MQSAISNTTTPDVPDSSAQHSPEAILTAFQKYAEKQLGICDRSTPKQMSPFHQECSEDFFQRFYKLENPTMAYKLAEMILMVYGSTVYLYDELLFQASKLTVGPGNELVMGEWECPDVESDSDEDSSCPDHCPDCLNSVPASSPPETVILQAYQKEAERILGKCDRSTPKPPTPRFRSFTEAWFSERFKLEHPTTMYLIAEMVIVAFGNIVFEYDDMLFQARRLTVGPNNELVRGDWERPDVESDSDSDGEDSDGEEHSQTCTAPVPTPAATVVLQAFQSLVDRNMGVHDYSRPKRMSPRQQESTEQWFAQHFRLRNPTTSFCLGDTVVMAFGDEVYEFNEVNYEARRLTVGPRNELVMGEWDAPDESDSESDGE
ncbi:hypothetical protein BJ508DRAFT_331464 [Ascobolus immersus RN42]|uniref:Uncharacterized protein n=1 Tax=Ascobolus immersus RN42 TaxID=1160509 RepID=A0A3N4HQT2_ASCIM|nr:hypothetical protein BJ508DRAFT_331464 [Ascobolus immersus RN42]